MKVLILIVYTIIPNGFLLDSRSTPAPPVSGRLTSGFDRGPLQRLDKLIKTVLLLSYYLHWMNIPTKNKIMGNVDKENWKKSLVYVRMHSFMVVIDLDIH